MSIIVESVFNIYSEIIHQELSENDRKLKFILRVYPEFTSPTIKTLTRKCVPATYYRTSRKTDSTAVRLYGSFSTTTMLIFCIVRHQVW